jgi:hypothetical protein
MAAGMLEAQFDEGAAESVPAHEGLDGYAPQAPRCIALRAWQCFPAHRRDRNRALIFIHGHVQRRWFVVTAKATRIGLIVEQDRASKGQHVLSRDGMYRKKRGAIGHKNSK